MYASATAPSEYVKSPSGPSCCDRLEYSASKCGSAGSPRKFQMPACALIDCSFSATLPYCILRLHIRAFVDCLSTHLNPCVCFKGQPLGAQYHRRIDSMSAAQPSSDKGALQAQRSFGIPDTSVVHCLTYSFDRFIVSGRCVYRAVFQQAMERAKGAGSVQCVISDEPDECLPEEHQCLPLPIAIPSSWQTNANRSLKASIFAENGCVGT